MDWPVALLQNILELILEVGQRAFYRRCDLHLGLASLIVGVGALIEPLSRSSRLWPRPALGPPAGKTATNAAEWRRGRSMSGPLTCAAFSLRRLVRATYY